MDDDKSSNMDQIRMSSFAGVFAAIVAPAHGSGTSADLQQLPRTRQDVVVEETTLRAEAPVSNPRVAPINTPAIEDRGLPLSGGNLHGDALDEPHEAQPNVGNSREKNAYQAVDRYPIKWPIAPQHCRRWGKPETYVIFNLSAKSPDGTSLERLSDVGPSLRDRSISPTRCPRYLRAG